jgi:hypothetical protein
MLARELEVGKGSGYCPITMPAHQQATGWPSRILGIETRAFKVFSSGLETKSCDPCATLQDF